MGVGGVGGGGGRVGEDAIDYDSDRKLTCNERSFGVLRTRMSA